MLTRPGHPDHAADVADYYRDPRPPLPACLRAARALLFSISGLTAAGAVHLWVSIGELLFGLGTVLIFFVLVAVGIVLGLRIERGRMGVWAGILALEIVEVLWLLGQVADNTFLAAGLGPPVAVTVLVCLPSSWAYFRRP